MIQSLRRSVNEKRVLVPLPVEPSMVTELLHVTPVSKRPVNQSSAYTHGRGVNSPVSQFFDM